MEQKFVFSDKTVDRKHFQILLDEHSYNEEIQVPIEISKETRN